MVLIVVGLGTLGSVVYAIAICELIIFYKKKQQRQGMGAGAGAGALQNIME